MNIFHIGEIVDMGIEKEKRRRDFYNLVSQHFGEGEVRSLFVRLRDWEDRHVQKFFAIRKTLADDETTESYPGELDVYMRSLVDERLYAQVAPDAFAKNIKTPLDAIDYALGFEKDALLFFLELESYVTLAHKEVIQQLAGEEKQHIVYLSVLKKQLIE